MAVSLLFAILLIIAVIILLIVAALYFVPVIVSAVADCAEDALGGSAMITWGIVGVKVLIEEGDQKLQVLLVGYPVLERDLREMMAAAPKKEEIEEEHKPGIPASEYIGAAKDLWPHFKIVLDAFLRSLTLEKLHGDVTLGLSSPASTGIIYGYCTAVRYTLWPLEPVDIRMTPVFDHEVFSGTLIFRMAIRRPLLIIIPALSALLKKPVRQRLRQMSGRGAASG
jgi:hypothetical protein